MRGNGVCMDLSDIFYDAARSHKTVVKPAPQRGAASQPNAAVAVEQPHDPSAATSTNNDDDEWAEKQVQTFSKWLNYLFYPTESDNSEEQGALSGLVLQQRMAQERLAAFEVWSDEKDMGQLRRVISSEIGRQRIALRTDRDLYANLNQRNKIVSLLLSYSTPWLRLGLETVFGTIIQPDVSTSQRSSSSSNLVRAGRRVRGFGWRSRISLCTASCPTPKY